MGIETRNGAGKYYYRKIREGDRVRSVYMGSGNRAELFAAVDQADRQARACRDVEDPAAVQLVTTVEAYCDEVSEIVRAHLEASGYHRHKRGEWRKRRWTKTAIEKD